MWWRGEEGHEDVPVVHHEGHPGGVDIGQDGGLGEHDALGEARCARGEEDDGVAVRIHLAWLGQELRRPMARGIEPGFHRLRGGLIPGGLPPGKVEVQDQLQAEAGAKGPVLEGGVAEEELPRDAEGLAAGDLEIPQDPRTIQGGIQGNHDQARRDDGEIAHAPFWPVLREDGDPIAPAKARGEEPRAEALGLAPQLRIGGEALILVVARSPAKGGLVAPPPGNTVHEGPEILEGAIGQTGIESPIIHQTILFCNLEKGVEIQFPSGAGRRDSPGLEDPGVDLAIDAHLAALVEDGGLASGDETGILTAGAGGGFGHREVPAQIEEQGRELGGDLVEIGAGVGGEKAEVLPRGDPIVLGRVLEGHLAHLEETVGVGGLARDRLGIEEGRQGGGADELVVLRHGVGDPDKGLAGSWPMRSAKSLPEPR